MKKTRLFTQSRLVRVLAVGAATVALCVGLSFVGGELKEGARSTKIDGGAMLHAADAIDIAAWAGARGAAKLVRETNIAMNTLFAHIAVLAPISQFLSGTQNVVPDSYPGYYIRLKDDDTTVDVALGGKTFSNSLQIWYSLDGVDFTKCLEFFFDSYSDPTTGEGVLLVIRPYYFNNGAFYENNEMYMVRYKKDGSDVLHMVITASNYYGAPASDHTFKYGDTVNPSAPVKAVKYRARLSDDGVNYTFAGLAQTNQQIDSTSCAYSSGTSYYTLAFVAKKESPNYSMAKFGWDNSPNVFVLCGNASNPLNYGYFKSTEPFFVYDQVDATNPVIAGYPTDAEVDAVKLENAGDPELDVSSLPTEVIFNSTSIP